MPHQKWPPSLSRFIQCGSLPGGRRRKTLAAHVTTERMWVVTWAPGFDRGGGGYDNANSDEFWEEVNGSIIKTLKAHRAELDGPAAK